MLEVVPNSQPTAGMDRESLRQRELSQILLTIIRVRVVFVPIAAIFLTLIVLYDADPWRMIALAVVVGVQAVVIGFDLVRLRRATGYPVAYVPTDFMFMILLQTGVIWLTGALESPLVVIYVPLGIMSGVVFGSARPRWLMVGLILTFLWLMTVLPLLGLVPRTLPSFLDMGPGLNARPIYSLTSAGVLTFVVLLGSVVGAAVHRAINRMLGQAMGARQQALESLTERNQELVHLSGAIAHELKNPLASIQGLVQLLDRPGASPERQASRVQVLRGEVTRMREILDEFLNFSRPLGDLTIEPVELGVLLDELASLHEGLAHAKGIGITRSFQVHAPTPVDPRKIKQALVNLLQNALEATPTGGRVELLARRNGEEIVLGVRDSGPGVDEELLQRATEAGVTSKPEGSGIGLAVARAIAEQHGGRLTLENPPQGGCLALIHIPDHDDKEDR